MEKQKSVLITGCSEGGIGDALAQEFLKKGCKVFATARNLNSVQHLKELGCEVYKLDVTDIESVKSAVEFAEKRTGGELGVLVNNAGTAYNQTVLDTDIAMSKQQFDVNYWGLLSTTQQFFPLLRKGKGTIVNVGSAINLVPTPYTSPYRSTKAAVEVLSHAMRVEMEPFGLHVVHINLAFVRTHLAEKAPGSGRLAENTPYEPIRTKAEEYMNMVPPYIAGDVFARRLVPQVLKKNPPTMIYDGATINSLRILSFLGGIFGPRMFDWLWSFMDGLPDLRKIVKAEDQAKLKSV